MPEAASADKNSNADDDKPIKPVAQEADQAEIQQE